MQKIIITVIFFIGSCTLSLTAQKATDHQYPVEQLKEDLAILKEQLEKVHIGLYTYTPKAEMDQVFADIKKQITQPMTSIEFYRILCPINTALRNGHSALIPSSEYVQLVRTKEEILPLDVYWNEGQLYVRKNMTKETIPEGSIIESINGERADAVFQELTAAVWRDGYNTTSPETIVSDRFYHFYPFIKGLPDTFDLELSSPSGAPIKVQVAAKQQKEIDVIRKEKYGIEKRWVEDDTPALELAIDGKIATMTIRSFGQSFVRKEKKQKFKKFYKSAFNKIHQAGVEHLILDLRSNGGGDPMPTIELFAYLHDEPFIFYKNITTKVKRIPEKHLYDISFWDRLSLILGTKKKGTFYEPNGIAKALMVQGMNPSQPNKPYYGGKVYVLTNARSFSATGEMTAIIKQHNRATFIGEEPGGNPNENVSGIMVPLILPHTKNRIIISFMRWEMNVDFENTGRGILPDYPVRPSIEDILSGHDRVMAFTLDLIQQE